MTLRDRYSMGMQLDTDDGWVSPTNQRKFQSSAQRHPAAAAGISGNRNLRDKKNTVKVNCTQLTIQSRDGDSVESSSHMQPTSPSLMMATADDESVPIWSYRASAPPTGSSLRSGRIGCRWLMFLVVCITFYHLLTLQPISVSGSCPLDSSSLTIWTGTLTSCEILYQFLLTPDGRRIGLCQASPQGGYTIYQLNTPMQPTRIFSTFVSVDSTIGCTEAFEIGWAEEISALLVRCTASVGSTHQFILAIPMNDTSSYNQTGPVIRTTVNLDVCAPSTTHSDGKFYLGNYVGPDIGSPFGYLLWNCGLDLVALSLSSSQLLPISTCPFLTTELPLLYVQEYSLVIHQCDNRIYQITLSTYNLTQSPFIDYYDTTQSFSDLFYDSRYQQPVLFAVDANTMDILLWNLTDRSSSLVVSESDCVGYVRMGLDMTRGDSIPGVLLSCTQQTNSLLAAYIDQDGLWTFQPVLSADQCIPFFVSMPSDAHSLDLMCNVGYGSYATAIFVAETITGTTSSVFGPSCGPYRILYDPIHDETFSICIISKQVNLLRNGITTPLITLSTCNGNNNMVVDPLNHLIYVVCVQDGYLGGIWVVDLNSPQLTVTQIFFATTCVPNNVYLQSRLDPSDGLGTAILFIVCGVFNANSELVHIVVNGTQPITTSLTPILQNSCVNPISIFHHTKNEILYILCTNRTIGLKRDGSEILIDMTNFNCPASHYLLEDFTDPNRLVLMCGQTPAIITGDIINGLSINITSTGTSLCLGLGSLPPQQDPVSGLFYVKACQPLMQTFSITSLGQVVLGSSFVTTCPNDVVFDFKVDSSGTIRLACIRSPVVVMSTQFRCMNGFYWTNGRCQNCELGTARTVRANNGPGSSSIISSPWSCATCQPGTIAPLKGQSICSNCQPGLFTKDYGSIVCGPCLPGEAQAATGQSVCATCQPGFYASSTGTPSCSPCPLGQASPINGTISCQSCAPGSYANITGLTECYLAEPGTVVLTVGAHYSAECQPGTFTNSSGLSFCSSCPVGYEQPKSGQTGCNPCQPGFYADKPGTSVCEPCPLGTASAKFGTVLCHSCYPGSYSNSTGLTDCYLSEPGSEVRGIGAQNSTACAPGSYSSSSGTLICSLCPIGRYQPESGATDCIQAESGYMVDLPGQTDHILCLAGTISDSSLESSSCRSCSRGTYTDIDGQSICQDCSIGKYASGLGSQQCQPCQPGSYASKNQTIYCTPCIPGSASNLIGLNDSCHPCPPGQAQPIEGQTICVPCTPPYYSTNPGSPTCTLCPYQVSLDHTSCGLNPCPNNYEYIDTIGCTACPLGEYSNNATIGGCVNCLLGYYTPERGLDCTSCSQSSDQVGLICVGGLASVKTDYFAYLTDPDPITGIQLYATQPCPIGFCPGGPLQFSTDVVVTNSTSGGGSGSSTNTTSTITYCQFPRLNSPDNLLCGACVDGYLPWAAKCVSCTEVNSGLFFGGFVLSLALVIFLLRSGGSAAGLLAVLLYFIQTAVLEIGSISQWLNWLHIVNFGTESTSACLAPWSPIQQMIFSVCIPLILLSEVVILGIGHKLIAYYYSRTNNSNESESSNAISRWFCQFALSYSLERYLSGSMSVLLFTYTPVTVACFKYLYCIDVGSHHRLVFTAPTIDCYSSAYRQGLGLVGFTIAIYVIGFPLRIFIFLYRLRHQSTTTIARPSTVSSLPPSSSSEEDYSLDVRSADQLSQRQPSSDSDSFQQSDNTSTTAALYGPLYLMFRPHAWFYQPFILLRRASFVLISVLLVQEPSVRFLGYALRNFASLLIHLYLHPFSHPTMNHLETCSQILLILVSMVLAAYLPPYSIAIQLFVLFAILPFGCGLVILVLKQQLTQLHQSLSKKSKGSQINQNSQSDDSDAPVVPGTSSSSSETPLDDAATRAVAFAPPSLIPNPLHQSRLTHPPPPLLPPTSPHLTEANLNDIELATYNNNTVYSHQQLSTPTHSTNGMNEHHLDGTTLIMNGTKDQVIDSETESIAF